MDSGKDHFLVPPGHQAFHLCLHIFRLPASHPAPGIGDYAVAAELVAAVLYLDECPCMVRDIVHIKGLIFIGPANIQHVYSGFRPFLFLKPAFHIFIQYPRQLAFFIIADDHVHACIFLKRIRRHLHVTAGRHHHGFRIQLLGPVQHLT